MYIHICNHIYIYTYIIINIIVKIYIYTYIHTYVLYMVCIYIYVIHTYPQRPQNLAMNSARNKPRRQQIPSTQAAVATVVGLKFVL